jgi:hypothetical protein
VAQSAVGERRRTEPQNRRDSLRCTRPHFSPGGSRGGDGNPIEGPNFFPLQVSSTDPGRALITGSPHDFEAFDAPTLRGIGTPPPYFHNNIAETLEDAVECYRDHFHDKFPSLSLPDEKEPGPDGVSSDTPNA